MLLGILRTAWFLLCLLVFGYTFIVSGIIINLLQCCSLVIWPFSRKIYRIINCKLAYYHWCQLVFIGNWWSGSEIVLYSETKDHHMWGHESSLIILNHHDEIDWLFGWILCFHYNVLGASKVFAKNSLKYVPFIGWSWILLEMIFLRRDWNRDKPYLIEQLKVLAEYPLHCWTLLFCEGTRFTESKKARSNEIARAKGLPELKHHLLPRTKGFVVVMEAFKGKVPAIYDCTLSCSADYAEPTMYNVVMGRKCQGHMLVRRIKITDVPTDTEENTANFCHQIYQFKDRAYEHFQKNQTYENFEGGKFHKHVIPRRYASLLIETFWVLVLAVPSFYYFISLMINGSLWVTVTVFVFIVLSVLLIRAMISVTDRHQGSTYGKVAQKDENNGIVMNGSNKKIQ
ncbi:1-acyl-sn-glycerol-3-phosphate acyltransferase gamma-like [Saccoglossus kowalevskii]